MVETGFPKVCFNLLLIHWLLWCWIMKNMNTRGHAGAPISGNIYVNRWIWWRIIFYFVWLGGEPLSLSISLHIWLLLLTSNSIIPVAFNLISKLNSIHWNSPFFSFWCAVSSNIPFSLSIFNHFPFPLPYMYLPHFKFILQRFFLWCYVLFYNNCLLYCIFFNPFFFFLISFCRHWRKMSWP